MAKNKSESQNAQDFSLLEQLLKEGGVEIALDRPMYAAEACGDVALVGYFIDLCAMPPIDQGKGKEPRPWSAFPVLLTHPSKGIDREKNVVDVEQGQEMLVPATFQIQAALGRFARDPEVMHELAIQPKAKIDIGGGKSFWTYRVIRTGKTQKRSAAYALTNAPATPALPEGEVAAALPGGGTYDPKTGVVTKDPVNASASS